LYLKSTETDRLRDSKQFAAQIVSAPLELDSIACCSDWRLPKAGPCLLLSCGELVHLLASLTDSHWVTDCEPHCHRKMRYLAKGVWRCRIAGHRARCVSARRREHGCHSLAAYFHFRRSTPWDSGRAATLTVEIRFEVLDPVDHDQWLPSQVANSQGDPSWNEQFRAPDLHL
jgi:hypothetical protein